MTSLAEKNLESGGSMLQAFRLSSEDAARVICAEALVFDCVHAVFQAVAASMSHNVNLQGSWDGSGSKLCPWYVNVGEVCT